MLRDISKERGYDLSKTLNEIRPTYRFNENVRYRPSTIVALEVQILKMRFENDFNPVGTVILLLYNLEDIAEAAYRS